MMKLGVSMFKLLLFRGSPRSDIDEVERWNSKLPCDTLIVRYVNEFMAYEYARGFFLNHKEYDYLVIATDDIVVTPKDITQLQEDLDGGIPYDLIQKQERKEKYYPVLSGMMNVDEEDYEDQWGNLNICTELATKDRTARFYVWVKNNQLPIEDIFNVKFAGFGLTAIRRDIIEIPGFNFASDGIFRGTGVEHGASLDLVFAWFCQENHIPQFCDQRINMHHLRHHGMSHVGERAREVEWNGKNIRFGDV